MMSVRDTIQKLKMKLPSDVKLAAVSKFHPVDAIIEAYSAGQRIFAESRSQELYAKVKELDGMRDSDGNSLYPDIEWHFIGHLQTNKLKMVLPYVSLVQSVDSLHLLEAIDRWGKDNARVINVLLECHVAAEQTKQGFSEEEIRQVLTGKRQYPNVKFCGLMGMATFTDDMTVVRGDFARLKHLFDEFFSPDFRELSIGMSEDYRIALEYGSTMVRIGTMIFGPRVY